MERVVLPCCGGLVRPVPAQPSGARAPTGVGRDVAGDAGSLSALALLVAEVLADDHDPPVPTDHLALVTDLLDARLDLHGCLSFRRRRGPRAAVLVSVC